MNPAFGGARAFVGACNLELAIDSIPVLGATERIIATKGPFGTMDLGNQVGVIATHLVATVRIRDFTLVCKSGGILFKFATATVPVEPLFELSQMLGLIPSRTRFVVVKHTRVGADASERYRLQSNQIGDEKPDAYLVIGVLVLAALDRNSGSGEE